MNGTFLIIFGSQYFALETLSSVGQGFPRPWIKRPVSFILEIYALLMHKASNQKHMVSHGIVDANDFNSGKYMPLRILLMGFHPMLMLRWGLFCRGTGPNFVQFITRYLVHRLEHKHEQASQVRSAPYSVAK